MDNQTFELPNLNLKSKPGVFAQGELDSGTKLLLNHLPKIEDRMVIADLGCGTGVIGLSIAKLNPRAHVHLLDANIRAINLANENIEKNNIKNVEVFLSDIFSTVGNRKYHLILSNPPQSLGNVFLEEILKSSIEHLKDEGKIYWVVKRNIKSFIERLFSKYFKDWQIVASNNSYIVVKGEKRNG